MRVLFQEGIPNLFFQELESRGFIIERIATQREEALDILKKFPDAEAIFFRANFRIDEKILDTLPRLRLAALVSTGIDNVDISGLTRRKIRFVSGEGANAQAVFDYVVQALCAGRFDFERESLGVVGCGHIGQRLLAFFNSLGVKTEFFDPFREDKGSLQAVLQCDVVTFHTSLSRQGDFATENMLDAQYFSAVKKKLRVIQAARGPLWQREFYHSLHAHPSVQLLAQDVYPDEPPHEKDLSLALFSTPHIAGYSSRGRLGGIVKGIQTLLPDFVSVGLIPAGQAWFLEDEAECFKKNWNSFNALRDGYFWRKEFHEYNEEEKQNFSARYPHVPQRILDALFQFTGVSVAGD